MTYNVFSGMLNPAQSISQPVMLWHWWFDDMKSVAQACKNLLQTFKSLLLETHCEL